MEASICKELLSFYGTDRQAALQGDPQLFSLPKTYTILGYYLSLIIRPIISQLIIWFIKCQKYDYHTFQKPEATSFIVICLTNNPKTKDIQYISTQDKKILTIEKVEPTNVRNKLNESITKQITDDQNKCRLIFCRLTYRLIVSALQCIKAEVGNF